MRKSEDNVEQKIKSGMRADKPKLKYYRRMENGKQDNGDKITIT